MVYDIKILKNGKWVYIAKNVSKKEMQRLRKKYMSQGYNAMAWGK